MKTSLVHISGLLIGKLMVHKSFGMPVTHSFWNVIHSSNYLCKFSFLFLPINFYTLYSLIVTVYIDTLWHYIIHTVVIPKPKITTRPINATVERVGLPITLTCRVSGDPSHYWVGWVYKNSIIQRGNGHSHSLSTSPSFISSNGTTHHITIHTVTVPGKYTCQVYSIEGEQLDHVTHQVSIKG